MGARFRLDQLPEHVQAQVTKQLYATNPPCSKIPDAKPEHHQAPALGGPVQGKNEGFQRTIVSFVGYRVKPLDPDNFAGSVKDLLDGLRHSSILGGDEWWRIKLETEQKKVAHYKDERTEITVTYPWQP